MKKLVTESLGSFLHEAKSVGPIDMKKFKEIANAINVLDMDYGITYFNEGEKKILVNLGDSNPFDEQMLTMIIKEGIFPNYSDSKDYDVIIENEVGRPGEGWKKIE